MRRVRHPLNALARALQRALGGDRGGGLILIGAALAAIGIANSPLRGGYQHAFHARLAWSPVPELDSWHLWINDALMAVFFFVVGLEIKREVVAGDLADPARRRLPVIAAIAGMAAPAGLFLLVAGARAPLARGWAVPAATDIAFAMGIVALLGRRVPRALRLFLLTVAIVDDLGAVLIIAVFYTGAIAMGWLVAALGVLGGLIALNRARVGAGWAYAALALALWYCTLRAGIHPTIAGVAAALTVPLALDREGDSPLLRFEHALVPWNGYLVVPLFGFANAGVPLGALSAGAPGRALALAIAIGLFAGKQLGIFGAILVADRLGVARRPAGASWPQIWGVAALCGIGFTMSLFVGALAFGAAPALYEDAKLGVLAGSLASALLGMIVLRAAAPAADPG